MCQSDGQFFVSFVPVLWLEVIAKNNDCIYSRTETKILQFLGLLRLQTRPAVVSREELRYTVLSGWGK